MRARLVALLGRRRRRNTLTINVSPGVSADELAMKIPGAVKPITDHWHCGVCFKPHPTILKAALCCVRPLPDLA